MKIAYLTYPSAFQNIGGGEIQLLKTREAVQNEGVQVALFDSWSARIEQYDLLHIFGSVKDCLGLAAVAQSRGVKVVVSPIWWSDYRRAFFIEASVREKAEFVVRHTMKLAMPWFPSARRRLLSMADLLLPNSEMEKKQIARQFALPESKIRVVYNGVDTAFEKTDGGAAFRKSYGDAEFVLSVGRMEPRKNQLSLIRAVQKIPGMRLILIGSPVSGYEAYDAQCRKEGQGFVTFLPTLAHEDPLLKSAYAACRLFVLPGWFETPGLVALEAGLAGARVVATSGGSTREYFQGFVDYLNPASVGDIRRNILKNRNTSSGKALQDHIRTHFTWRRVGLDTIACYRELLGGASAA